ncbi:MAG: dGTPase [Candidatus Aeolococcus gillhamiae]|uniref:DGTPase n=1 Tax=Candidatus Aeolococcus gillhamiae TaxID=3127015 RepID=A0A2W6AZ57_9BACT|nr:MAG: dGTPase [Candidatus Dormibacter sp. RRmetagenome_bin12]
MASKQVADTLAAHALGLPDAWQDFPWEGDRVAKVRKKIFAFLTSDDTGSLGVKLPESGGFALSLSCAKPMAYGLGRHSWVTLQLGDPSAPDVEVLREWVTESYRAVAPKTLIKRLDAAG